MKKTRRDFMQVLAMSFAGIGGALSLWPFINALNPPRENEKTRKEKSLEVDLGDIPKGHSKTVMWKGKPVFIRHRTEDEIAAARKVDIKSLPHRQEDKQRVQKPEWLVVIGVCTHLGCVPAGQKENDNKGKYGGWLCRCHGTHFDTSGRVRKGPAPKNMAVPPYKFLNDTTIKIG